jgi:hypothetical protein
MSRAGDFSLLHSVRTGFKDRSVSYRMGIWGCFPGIKPELENDLSTPSSAKVKNVQELV